VTARPQPTLLGSLHLDEVWLDDRARCGRWALRGLDLTLTAGTLVVVLAGPDEGGPDAVIDVVAGRRVPTRGAVSIDGVDLRDLDRAAHRQAVVELEVHPGGERRLCLPQSTMVAVRPSPTTLAAADVVVVLEDGVQRS
jgi:ABC-type bacteriocin/lantibiotic exporter with double-glycine peptidase domain